MAGAAQALEPPPTPLDVVREMVALADVLDGKIRAYRQAERDMVTKRHGADIAEAKAYLRAAGKPVEERKRLALVECEYEEGPALVAEALVRVLKAEIKALDTMIDITRSKGTTVRAEIKASSYEMAP